MPQITAYVEFVWEEALINGSGLKLNQVLQVTLDTAELTLLIKCFLLG